MRKYRVLAITIFAAALQGCQTAASLCGGWTPPPKVNNPVALVQQERTLANWVASTDEHGKKNKCWE